jgi:hypothetical protein
MTKIDNDAPNGLPASKGELPASKGDSAGLIEYSDEGACSELAKQGHDGEPARAANLLSDVICFIELRDYDCEVVISPADF